MTTTTLSEDVGGAVTPEQEPRPQTDGRATEPLRVALLGCGNVGSQVARILLEDAEELAARTGARLELAGIAVRNPRAPREADLPAGLFTDDAAALDALRERVNALAASFPLYPELSAGNASAESTHDHAEAAMNGVS